MKEASGELNMTAVTLVAIAAIGALFYAFVWPSVKNNIQIRTRCANAQGCSACGSATDGMMECTWIDESGDPVPVSCPCDNEDLTR